MVMVQWEACAGLPPATLDDVTAAIASGSKSELLGKLHVALLRLLHYDMEESHLMHQVLPSTLQYRGTAAAHGLDAPMLTGLEDQHGAWQLDCRSDSGLEPWSCH